MERADDVRKILVIFENSMDIRKICCYVSLFGILKLALSYGF